jgi:hypothetical protein
LFPFTVSTTNSAFAEMVSGESEIIRTESGQLFQVTIAVQVQPHKSKGNRAMNTMRTSMRKLLELKERKSDMIRIRPQRGARFTRIISVAAPEEKDRAHIDV